MSFRPEPAFSHAEPEKTAILLVNLGTPSAPTTRAVRRYLEEFLTDRRVVEISRVVWAAILHGVILHDRPRRSAAKYRMVWTPEGSPLAVHTERQAALLRGLLGERLGSAAPVIEHAMRYGEPSMTGALSRLQALRCTRILVIPLYPQYAASTTASAMDAVFSFLARTRHIPEVRYVKHFHDEPLYIEALARRIEAHWAINGRPDKLVMSFHGLPEYTLELGDPYHCECMKTARLLAERLALPRDMWVASFQSRFGRARWLQPYTAEILGSLARAGVGRVDVVAPGFVADCLETLEELAIEGRKLFLDAGGRTYSTIACLNEEPAWIEALAKIALDQLQGWGRAETPEALAVRQQRAVAQGARS